MCCFLEPELEIYTPLAPLFRGEGFVAGVCVLTPLVLLVIWGAFLPSRKRGRFYKVKSGVCFQFVEISKNIIFEYTPQCHENILQPQTESIRQTVKK